MKEQNRSIIVGLLTTMIIGALSVVVQTDCNASTTEQTWIPLNQDIKVGGGYPKLYGYIRVNVSDVVYINWTAGALQYGQGTLDISVSTTSAVINGSDNFNNLYYGSKCYKLSFSYGQYPPQYGWLRMGSYDLIQIEVSIATANNAQTLNFSVQREIPDIYEINSTLNQTVNRLNDTANLLKSTINNTKENISDIYNQITGLKSFVNDSDIGLLNQIDESFDSLSSDLAVLNLSFQDNLTVIQAYLEYLNSSLILLNSQLEILNHTEINDVDSLWNNLNDLRNYTIKAHDILFDIINQTNSNSTIRDNRLSESLDAIHNLTDILTVKINDTNGQVKDNYQNITNKTTSLKSDNDALMNEIEKLRHDFAKNTTKTNTDIENIKRDGLNMAILTGIIGVITGIVITVTGILIYDRKVKKRYGGVGVHDPDSNR